MLMPLTVTTLGGLTVLMSLSYVTSNWDPATGHVQFVRPKKQWLDKLEHVITTPSIQVAECATNTRLRFPRIQMYAYFKIEHDKDTYHGCPYGTCYASEAFPTVDDLEINADSHSFIWHNKGGFEGTGVREISNPKTGQAGYEQSLTGKYIDGPPKFDQMQRFHDAKYPTFQKVNASTEPWPLNFAEILGVSKSPLRHPKCGRPCEMNADPGQDPSVKEGYKPAKAADHRRYEPTDAEEWPKCPKTPDGKIKFINKNPQHKGSGYCKLKPDSENCNSDDHRPPSQKGDCLKDPHAQGCNNEFSNEPPDCTTQTKADGCGNKPGRTSKKTTDCKADPNQELCKKSKEKKKQRHCKENPAARGCPMSGGKRLYCTRNPKKAGCKKLQKKKKKSYCLRHPGAKGCAVSGPGITDEASTR